MSGSNFNDTTNKPLNEGTYDPTSVVGDAFDMDNMVEGATNKILTASERSDISASASATPIISFGNGSISQNNTPRFITPWFDSGSAGTTLRGVVAPRAGTLRNLFYRNESPGGNGNDMVFTVFINGADPGSSLSITVASTTGTGNDLVNTVAVAAGDLISIQHTKPGGAIGSNSGTTNLSMEFV